MGSVWTMSRDVTVRWESGSAVPERAVIEQVIRQFFGPVATEVKWDQDRFFVTLAGEWSYPVKDLRSYNPGAVYRDDIREVNGGLDPRFLEVWPSVDLACLCVITRMADRFTNVCAEGLAAVFAQWWEGKVEKEGDWTPQKSLSERARDLHADYKRDLRAFIQRLNKLEQEDDLTDAAAMKVSELWDALDSRGDNHERFLELTKTLRRLARDTSKVSTLEADLAARKAKKATAKGKA